MGLREHVSWEAVRTFSSKIVWVNCTRLRCNADVFSCRHSQLSTLMPEIVRNLFQTSQLAAANPRHSFIQDGETGNYYLWSSQDPNRCFESFVWERQAMRYLRDHPEEFTLTDLAHACKKRDELDRRPLITVTNTGRMRIESCMAQPKTDDDMESEHCACLRCATEDMQLTVYDLHKKLLPSEDPEQCNKKERSYEILRCTRGRLSLQFVYAKLAMEWAERNCSKAIRTEKPKMD